MSTGHTPGPWYETKSGQQVLIIAEMSGDNVAVIYDSQDAHLIAEAGTVASECGMGPRALLEQRDELLKALKEWLDKEDASTPEGYTHNETPYKGRVRALIAKATAQPVTA